MKTLLTILITLAAVVPIHAERDPICLTHGPLLGHVTSSSVRVWGRTSDAGVYQVSYGTSADKFTQISESATTRIEDDNTGSITIEGLEPDTVYHYQLRLNELAQGLPRSFRTLPSAQGSRNAEYNPNGLFNFRFQISSCANQDPQVIFQYYDGRTGELDYAEAISLGRK